MNTNSSLKIIFAGTPEFSVKTLQALLKSHHQVIAVYTQPDRPAGRGRQLTASPVKQVAEQHRIPVYQPLTLRDATEQQRLADLGADLMVVVAYGLILPMPVLQAPRFGCINVHASLLPRWRGAAPIQRAIEAGDCETGVTIMQMDKGLDTGDMLYKVACPIVSSDTSATLHDRLAEMGAEALVTTLNDLDNFPPEKQDETKATYAQKISKEEAVLSFTQTAVELDRKIRAFNPWPVATVRCEGEVIRVWQTTVLPDMLVQQPGTIVKVSTEGLDVATENGILRIQKIQFPGGKVLSVGDVINARHPFVVGSTVG